MKKGDRIYTRRFCRVEIEAVYASRADAAQDGYTEPTHYNDDPEYGVVGKSLDMYHMTFAAYRK